MFPPPTFPPNAKEPEVFCDFPARTAVDLQKDDGGDVVTMSHHLSNGNIVRLHFRPEGAQGILNCLMSAMMTLAMERTDLSPEQREIIGRIDTAKIHARNLFRLARTFFAR